MEVMIKRKWLQDCGHREYKTDAKFPVVNVRERGGFKFYDVKVPWQEDPWPVIEWRLVGE